MERARLIANSYMVKFDGYDIPCEIRCRIYNDEVVSVSAYSERGGENKYYQIGYEDVVKAKKESRSVVLWLSDRKSGDIVFQGICTIDHVVFIAEVDEVLHYEFYARIVQNQETNKE
jgi:hypothetical protein